MTTTSGKPGISIAEELTIPDQLSPGNRLTWLGAHGYPTGYFLLLQTGDYLLLQQGGKIELEAA